MSPAVTSILLGAAALLVLAEVLVALRVARSASFSRTQKIAQIVLVFAVPLLGCALVWAVLSADGRSGIAGRGDHEEDVGASLPAAESLARGSDTD